MLPTSLNGSAFCLGTTDEGSAKVLTAQEAREARLKALEKSIEEKKSEKSIQQPVQQPRKVVTKEQQDELDINATRRMLELERQRRKNEKEILLKRFKADRG